MSNGKAPAKRKTIARRGPPRRPLSNPTAASVALRLAPRRVTVERLRLEPALFADTFLRNNEKGKSWRLSRHQRRVLARAFRRGRRGELRFRLVLWSEPKKSGKTFLAAMLLLWWAFTNSHTEIIVAANDLDQSVSRVFETAVALVKHNPALARLVTVRAEKLLFTNGTVVTAIASDYRGAAGSRHSLVIFDELWGFHSENAQRLYEELTPPVTEENAWVLVVTYAGFTGESKLLESMYQRGQAGTRVDAKLELYEADGLFMYWSHTPRQPWQTDAKAVRYYAEQARSLRPATFARLHRNEWVTAESIFITPALWDPNVDRDARPWLPARAGEPRLRIWVGVDVALKHDYSAVVAVTRTAEGQLQLIRHWLWKPSASTPLNLEATVEQALWECAQGYIVQAIYVDPFQMHRSMTTLQQAGLPVQEFPQTSQNLTRMGQTLLDLLRGHNLCLYRDDEMRAQALSVVAVESPRGFRLAKEKASRKIDLIVALSMACLAALDEPSSPPPLTDSDLAEMARQERALFRALGFRQEPEPYGGWENVVVDDEAGWSRDTSLWGRWTRGEF
jgi:phage terminase large subunit-like protein